MKRLIILFLLAVVLVSCGSGGGDETTTTQGLDVEYIGTVDGINTMDIYKFYDNGNLCYVAIVHGGSGISCIEDGS